MFFSTSLLAQNEKGFLFKNDKRRSYKIKFTNYKNLIIVNSKLNGIPMNFLLDTGVGKTILFGIEGNQEEIKENSQKILIKGVSGKKKAYAYRKQNNTLEIGKLKNTSQDIYVIFDKAFNVSDKIGYQVQGIIGHDFFSDLIVKINYIRNHLKIYNPEKFRKSLNRYDQVDIKLLKQKPYLKTKIKIEDAYEEYIFLLDLGSGDAIWLKPQKDEDPPEKSFDDILGYGFADIIKGLRSKAKGIKLGKKIINNPKIAFPDTLSYQGLKFTPKSGVIGSEVIRRFHWIFDYSNRKVYLKPNSSISEDFNYDMSGLVLKYDGYQTITSYQTLFPDVKAQTDNRSGYNKIKKPETNVRVELKPILKVGAVRPNSSAYEAGFVEGDEIIKINGRQAYRYNLEDISKILSSKEGEVVVFKIKRNESIYLKSITLKSRFVE